MTGLTWAILGLALGLAVPAAILYIRQRSGAESEAPAPVGHAAKPAPSSPNLSIPEQVQAKSLGRFRAVAIRAGLVCCKAAETAQGKRMLGKDAPSLPLSGCDQDQCRCTYTHYKDRRDDEDRRLVFGAFGGYGRFGTPNPGKSERRFREDRRLPDRRPGNGRGR